MSKIAAAEVARANSAAKIPDGRAEQAEVAAQKELAIRQLGAELEAERRATADAQLVAGRAQQTVQEYAERISTMQREMDAGAEDCKASAARKRAEGTASKKMSVLAMASIGGIFAMVVAIACMKRRRN